MNSNLYEIFKSQLENAKSVNEDYLSKAKNKYYDSGKPIELGDSILIAMLVGDVKENENEIPEISVKFILLNERDFDLYEIYEPDRQNSKSNFLPMLKLK
jgi:hypothetical protein